MLTVTNRARPALRILKCDLTSNTPMPDVTFEVPHKLAIVRANRYMVDASDCLIAYAWHPGNARELAEYAQRRARRGLLQVVILGRQQ